MDLHGEESQVLLSKIFLEIQAASLSEIKNKNGILERAIARQGEMTTAQLEEVLDLVGYLVYCFSTLIEVGRLLKDMTEAQVQELIVIREPFINNLGKMNMALLIRQYKDRE